MSIKVSLMQLASDNERRVRELANRVQPILDAGRTLGKHEAPFI